ncbi:MAG: hypothetical protein QJT81_18250 [Candidatus Thiothrix putei]|uniref:DUF7024 domain-containing protein n=1 Tax=Candidatus Thiothrix putei TaxID=3080811 RepID=A0AA95KNI3_9GAMM|nr:MAG: hypothetical protein QJT81_18250 [Candidatus Thiothrix putei]
MNIANRIRLGLIVLLCLFYAWLFWLMLNPVVSDEYSSYYIKRETFDWRPKRYPATLEEGFVFSRLGIPEFVASTAGLSMVEEWGRWSDAKLSPIVRIELREPLHGQICLVITARTIPKQIGKPVWLRMGQITQVWQLTTESVNTYQFDFLLPEQVSTIEIGPMLSGTPSDWNSDSKDLRKLGIGFYRLVILQEHCAKK